MERTKRRTRRNAPILQLDSLKTVLVVTRMIATLRRSASWRTRAADQCIRRKGETFFLPLLTPFSCVYSSRHKI